MPETRESAWHQATAEQRALVEIVRALTEDYLRLYGSLPTVDWLLKQIGLTP